LAPRRVGDRKVNACIMTGMHEHFINVMHSNSYMCRPHKIILEHYLLNDDG